MVSMTHVNKWRNLKFNWSNSWTSWISQNKKRYKKTSWPPWPKRHKNWNKSLTKNPHSDRLFNRFTFFQKQANPKISSKISHFHPQIKKNLFPCQNTQECAKAHSLKVFGQAFFKKLAGLDGRYASCSPMQPGCGQSPRSSRSFKLIYKGLLQWRKTGYALP